MISNTVNSLNQSHQRRPGILWWLLLNVYCSLLLKISEMLYNCSREYTTGNNILVYELSEGGERGQGRKSLLSSLLIFISWSVVFFSTSMVKMFLFKGAPFCIP